MVVETLDYYVGHRSLDWKSVDDAPDLEDATAQLNDVLLRRAYNLLDVKQGWYRANVFETIEIDVPLKNGGDSPEQEAVVRNQKVTYEDLPCWLSNVRKDVNTEPQSGKPQPRLRLLVCDWSGEGDYLPISCPEMASDLAKCLNIPPIFPSHQFYSKCHCMSVLFFFPFWSPFLLHCQFSQILHENVKIVMHSLHVTVRKPLEFSSIFYIHDDACVIERQYQSFPHSAQTSCKALWWSLRSPTLLNFLFTLAIDVKRNVKGDQKYKTGISQIVIKTGEGNNYARLYLDSYFLAYGYNPLTDSISGILVKRGWLQETDPVVDNIQRCVKYSSHPLLIASLVFWELVSSLDIRLYNCKADLEDVRKGHRQLERADQEPGLSFVLSDRDPNQARGKMGELLEGVDSHMTGVYNILQDEKFESLASIMVMLDRSFGDLSDRGEMEPETLKLFQFYETLSQKAKIMLNRKEKLAGEVQFLVQTVYNTLQRQSTTLAREDTAIALRDSSQMKAVAVLTMVFLPTTALAAVFSMSPFFNTDAEGRVTVSPEFWLFFVVTIPVTIFVMLSYVLWIQRQELVQQWSIVTKTRDSVTDTADKSPPLSACQSEITRDASLRTRSTGLSHTRGERSQGDLSLNVLEFRRGRGSRDSGSPGHDSTRNSIHRRPLSTNNSAAALEAGLAS